MDDILKYKKLHGHIRDYCIITENKTLLKQDCDILVLSSTHKDITYYAQRTRDPGEGYPGGS